MAKIRIVFLLLLSMSFSGHTHAEGSKPWLYNAPESEDYKVRLTSIEPFPGTPVVIGQEIHIKAAGTYLNRVSEHGDVTLVFQDETNRPLKGGALQVTEVVSGERGSFELEQRLVVPAGSKYLRIFIPLAPEGFLETYGEVSVTYPIVRSGE